jgi:PIN domain nuclease of toxin-antitoxin system
MAALVTKLVTGRPKVSDLRLTIVELLQTVEVSGHLLPVDMSIAAWQEFLNLKIPELHDRTICAVAAAYHTAVITNDQEIKTESISTIW